MMAVPPNLSRTQRGRGELGSGLVSLYPSVVFEKSRVFRQIFKQKVLGIKSLVLLDYLNDANFFFIHPVQRLSSYCSLVPWLSSKASSLGLGTERGQRRASSSPMTSGLFAPGHSSLCVQDI